MEISVLPLGAGQDVGRSCVIVRLGGRTVMFDCGMHMGYQDERRFPDFKALSKSGNFTHAVDAVIITHFHLDHCGALPYFTEVAGYSGPIYMTYPTKAIVPVMLEDFHKVMVDRRGEAELFSRRHISDCMRKVTPVNLHQTIKVDEDMEIRAYYAGHVLGAAMFYIRVGNQSVVYTGDYNMTPDRHLGAAYIERLRPDLLITESTYATTIRDSKRIRERDFLTQVHETIEQGGKVLIPVFALGRAQELCILLDEYWERMNLDVPIYFSSGMTSKANLYYSLLVNWTNEKVKQSHAERNTFGFARIRSWDRSLVDRPGPCVLFATPGMLHGGTSLEVFKHWATSEQNMVILPGYCVAGTVGNKLMAPGTKAIDLDKRTKLTVACKVRYLSFSAHADAKGIMRLVQQCGPRHVMLVHGEKAKMEFLSEKISKTFKLRVFMPPNGSTVTMRTSGAVPVDVSRRLVSKAWAEAQAATRAPAGSAADGDSEGSAETVAAVERVAVRGVLLTSEGASGVHEAALVDGSEVAPALGVTPINFTLGADVPLPHLGGAQASGHGVASANEGGSNASRKRPRVAEPPADVAEVDEAAVLGEAAEALRAALPAEAGRAVRVTAASSCVSVRSFRAILNPPATQDDDPSASPAPGAGWHLGCSWLQEDDALAAAALAALEQNLKPE
eukprot:jgi/Tetstr1/456907/TSEL_043577.t1